jgi:hypothetical protein
VFAVTSLKVMLEVALPAVPTPPPALLPPAPPSAR